MVGNVTLKKTIDRLSRNLSCFTENDILIENYMDIVKDNTHSQFIYYALADGIFNILKKTREGIVAFLVPLKHPPSQQVTIFKALGIKGCEQYAYCVYSGTPKP
jgi:hypothetical protein